MSALLSSLNILDFSTLLPGPFASKTLADLGAEVLRVESTKHPDFTRSLPSNSKGGLNAHASLNRSKQSIGLNLKQADAVKIVKKLVNKYDIVLEGYGQTGPYRNRAGHDLNYLAISGISNYSRRKNESPVPQGIQVADIAGGAYHVVIGILAAVIHRQLTGEGQYIDISMTDAMFSMNVFEGSNWLSGGSGAEPESTMLNGGTLYDYYKTQDGRWVSVSSLEPLFLNALIKALELPENLLNTSLDDQDAQKKLKEILKKRFLERPWSEWETVFANCDACVELVLEFPEAMQHQQFKAREMIVDIPDSSGSTQKQIASPFKFSSCKPEYRHAGVELGEQTDLVLKELGYTQKQINKLKKAGVCEDNKTG